jgi:chromosome segregation ATPase
VLITAVGCSSKTSEPGSKPQESKPGQTSGANSRAGAIKANQAAAETDSRTREQFLADANPLLEKIERKLAEWDAKAGELADEAKGHWMRDRETLDRLSQQLRAKVEELQEKGGDAWEELKEGATSAWANLNDAFKRAASHFEKDDAGKKQ